MSVDSSGGGPLGQELPFDDAPFDDGWFPDDADAPPADWDAPPDEPLRGRSGSRARSNGNGPARSGAAGRVEAPDVVGTLRRVIAAQHGQAFTDLASAVAEIRASETVLGELSGSQAKVFEAVLEILADLAANCESGAVNLADVPTARRYDEPVQAELAAIASLAEGPDLDQNPSVVWFGLKEAVQQQLARRSASEYLRSLEPLVTVDGAVDLFRRIQPPTTRKALTRVRAARTARQVVADKRTADAAREPIRFSSGYRTLDLALSNPDDVTGWISPGEGSVVAGPTGTGKSSFSYGLVPAMAQDLLNWGLLDAQVIFAHTEEESWVKIHAMGLDEGQAFHHLADTVVVANVGSSRKALAETVYDCVAVAHTRSLTTGRPITDFLPYALVLDYIQSISGQRETEVVATTMTAEFLLRGVQAWNPEEMAKFSGVSYQDYTGSPWPEGQEHHRVAGVYFAQLVKQDDKTLLYKPGLRDCQLSDFVLEDTSAAPPWRDPAGNGWGWEVREGDLRLFKQNAIRGSGVILQNATTIVILHRSRAYNNPAIPGPDGRLHLSDTRARLLLDKTRNGSQLPFVPMAFDLDHYGFRARYVDSAAEWAIRNGKFEPHACYARSGDPILPRRPAASPLAGISY